MPAFRLRVVVGPEDIDDLGHTNNVSYLRWVQQVAESHWSRLSRRVPASERDRLMWVVRRHEIEYLAQSYPGESLELITWVPSSGPATCDRATLVRRSGDGATLVEALSTYCILDAATGRPRRVTDSMRALFGNPPVVARPRREPFPPLPAEIEEAGAA
ncbi:MAG: acyl-CoA thioesterase [Gemmatimonadota bacterium]